MANSAGSRKRARQALKRNAHNSSLRSMVRTYMKKVITAIAAKDYESATTAYQVAVPYIDRMVSKGILHRNKAARHKSRLSARVRALKDG